MELKLSEEGRATVIALKGDLTIGEAEALFKKTVITLLAEGKTRILIDCTELRVVDSTGLGALVRALTTAQAAGGSTKLHSVGPHLRKLLEMTQLHSVFDMFESRDEAVASF